MPSVNQLTEQLRVNRNSAIKALARLENQGWVTAVQGKGFFVSDRPKKIKSMLTKHARYTTSMRNAGENPKVQLVNWSLDKYTVQEREIFNLSQEDKVYRLEILRFLGSIPFSIDTSSLPEKVVPKFEQYLNNFQSLHELLKDHYDFVPIKKYSIIESQMAQVNDAAILKLPENIPIIQKINVSVSYDGLPVEMDIRRIRGDMIQYVINYENI